MFAKQLSDLRSTARSSGRVTFYATITESAAAPCPALASLANQMGELQAAMAKLQVRPPVSTQDRNLSWRTLPAASRPPTAPRLAPSAESMADDASCWSNKGTL
jgi:hypothetical protein